MTQSPPAHVSPVALRWARETVGLPIEDAAKKIRVNIDKLERAEAGDDHLTFRQAETAANVYRRPLAMLFVSKPPDEESSETVFRRLRGAPALPWTYEMHTLIRRVRERQEAAVEIYDLLDEAPPWPSLEFALPTDGEELAAQTRAMLGISLDEQHGWLDHRGYRPLRAWIHAFERQGVLVMQDGTMDVEQNRGFASLHELVPVIVLNTNDDPRRTRIYDHS